MGVHDRGVTTRNGTPQITALPALAALTAAALAALLALPVLAGAAPNVYVTNRTSNNIGQYDAAANGTLAAKTPARVAAGSFPTGLQ